MSYLVNSATKKIQIEFHMAIEIQKALDMEEKRFMDLIYQSIQDSAREIRLTTGRPSSHATLEDALQQIAMLKAAKEAQQTGK